MSCGRPKKICSGSMRHRIKIVRRVLGTSSHYSAEPVYTRTIVLTTRAQIKTKGGTTEFNRINVDGSEVSHVFTIRAPRSLRVDSRDQVEDAAGNLYAILRVEDENEFGENLIIYAARWGEKQREAAV